MDETGIFVGSSMNHIYTNKNDDQGVSIIKNSKKRFTIAICVNSGGIFLPCFLLLNIVEMIMQIFF